MPSATEHTLRTLAATRGVYSLRQLAQAAGLDRRTVYGAASGRKRPTPESVRKLASALGMREPELSRILGGSVG